MTDLFEIFGALKSGPSEGLESNSLEFKEFANENSLHGSKELAEELVALCNSGGGRLIVGVRDSSNIVNSDWKSQLVGFPEVDLLTASARIRGKIKPSIALQLTNFKFEEKNYLVIDVPSRIDSLITTSSGKVYVRDGRSSRPMSPEEIAQAVKSLVAYDWTADLVDGLVDSLVSWPDVDEALHDFSARRGLPQLDRYAFLEAIGATTNGRLTRAGLLFFGTPDLIKARLGLMEFRFSWKTVSGALRCNDVWSSNLWNVVKKYREYFHDCNEAKSIEFRGKSYEVHLLDPIAFHEALMNALVHRDYSKDGIVAVDYNSKEIKISSPGSFYGGVTEDNIYRHQPRHRNKALAKLMMDFALVDRAGMGVLRMSLRSLRYGRSFPTFSQASGFVQVVMQAEYLRSGIFVIAERHESYGVVELVVLNSVYEVGSVSVDKLLSQLAKLTDSPWADVQDAVERMKFVEFCANRNEVLIRVTSPYREVLDVDRATSVSPVSARLVKLYTYLKKHGAASNSDITQHLQYKYGTQTSEFLRKTKFVKRVGNGPQAVWKLAN